MTSIIINAVMVGMSVWISSQLFHVTGLGLVFASVVIYIGVRFAFGLLLVALNAFTGRRGSDAITWS